MSVVKVGRVSGNMILTVFISFIISATIAFPLGYFVLWKPTYHIMMSNTDIGEGSIGSKAAENIPKVQSIEEMKNNDKFTVVLNQYPINITKYLDGVYYITLTLPNKENIAALINKNNIQKLDDNNICLPVGTLKKWKKTSKFKKDYKLNIYDGYYSDDLHYVDMMGDFDNIPTELSAKSYISNIIFIILYFSIAYLIRRYGVKKGWFRPELIKKKFEETEKSTIPKDDTERWILGTYAMWAGYIGDANLIGGLPKNPKNQNFMRKVYERDWGIKNTEEFKNMAAELTAPEGYNGTDKISLAWDWCRAMQIIGCGFFCDYLTREEMRTLSCEIGRKIQKEFSSWEDLCENYIDGYTRWRKSIGGDYEKSREEREQIYERIKNNPNSPYKLFFNMNLSEKVVINEVHSPEIL